jgi:Rap guanine nucleotide exchange factor 2
LFLFRYYIKNVMSSDQLIPEDSISELIKESQVHLLQLHAMETATQLMVEDFTIFRQIGKNDLFKGSIYTSDLTARFPKLKA